VTVAFTPLKVGQRTAQLAIQAPGNPTVPLRGAGTPGSPAAPELTPGSLAFGEQRVGDESPPQSVTLTNRAAIPLRLTAASITGATAGFRIDRNECTTAAVAADASCQLPVTFAPTEPGKHAGVLSLTIEGVAAAPSVVLTATAAGPNTPVVPDVIGLPRSDAEQKLQAVDLQPGVVTEAPHPDVAPGAVADQRPRPGITLTVGGAVDLVLSTGPATTTVPNVVGQPQANAEQLLDGAKLRTGTVTSQPDPSEEPGVVLASNPTAGDEVKLGSSVDLVVSTGPSGCAVPGLTGKTRDEATTALQKAGFSLGRVIEEESAAPRGTVIRTSLERGAEVAPCGPVDLVVSKGPPQPAKVAVPDVVGKPLGQARRLLDGKGLVGRPVTEEASETVRKGNVISSDPRAGTEVDKGSAVDLVVSTGPPPSPIN
jgi:serine/threonine-protein kinase